MLDGVLRAVVIHLNDLLTYLTHLCMQPSVICAVLVAACTSGLRKGTCYFSVNEFSLLFMQPLVRYAVSRGCTCEVVTVLLVI